MTPKIWADIPRNAVPLYSIIVKNNPHRILYLLTYGSRWKGDSYIKGGWLAAEEASSSHSTSPVEEPLNGRR